MRSAASWPQRWRCTTLRRGATGAKRTWVSIRSSTRWPPCGRSSRRSTIWSVARSPHRPTRRRPESATRRLRWWLVVSGSWFVGSIISSVTPLDDLFVLDLSRILSGPFCTMMLGDMGATVVKVEPPPRGDDTRLWGPPFVNGISSYFLSINRNKRSIGLNLKSPEGKDVLWKLIDRADVLVENFRPGVLEKLGFGYDAVSSRNPRIIYASISGYGQTGPYRDRPGYDVVAQGESGIVDLNGEPDRQPVKVGASIADIVAGLYAYQGILLALLARHRTGRGQRIDVALLDGMISTLTYQAMSYLATGTSPKRL